MEYILEMKGVKKYFPGVKALDGVDFRLRPGEVHALLGENGAGKSTLIKILTGIYTIDEGEIILRGEPIKIAAVNDARAHHIAAIHQELCLVPYMSVAQNIYLGRELKKKGGAVDDVEMNRQTQQLLDSMEMDIRATDLVGRFSIAQQQQVEIAKAVAVNAEILIMDEPSSSLSNKEVRMLFATIERLKRQGTSIIYISHRLEELFEISDRVSILRDGRYIATRDTAATNRDELVAMMVGRELGEYFTKDSTPQPEICLEVRGMTRAGVFEDVSFQIHKGDILGVSGMVGAGRTELARAIFGVDRPDGGEVLLEGKPLRVRHVWDAMKAGIALVPESRMEQGLILIQTVAYNTTISVLKRFLKFPRWRRRQEEQFVGDAIARFEAQYPDIKVNYRTGTRIEDYADWLGNQLLAGTAPDVYVVLGDDFETLASVGALKELSPLARRDASFDVDAYYPVALQMCRMDGGLYALPSEAVPKIMLVNETLLESNGISLDHTDFRWDSFYQICRQLTRDTDADGFIDQYGVAGFTWDIPVYTSGLSLFDGQTPRLNDPDIYEAIAAYQRLVSLDRGGATEHLFEMGKVGFLVTDFSEFLANKTFPYRLTHHADFSWSCVPLPAMEGAAKSTAPAELLMYGMYSQTAHADEAWELLKFIAYNKDTQLSQLSLSGVLSAQKQINLSADAQSILQTQLTQEGGFNLTEISDWIEFSVPQPTFRHYSNVYALIDSQITAAIREGTFSQKTMIRLQKDVLSYLSG